MAFKNYSVLRLVVWWWWFITLNARTPNQCSWWKQVSRSNRALHTSIYAHFANSKRKTKKKKNQPTSSSHTCWYESLIATNLPRLCVFFFSNNATLWLYKGPSVLLKQLQNQMIDHKTAFWMKEKGCFFVN